MEAWTAVEKTVSEEGAPLTRLGPAMIALANFCEAVPDPDRRVPYVCHVDEVFVGILECQVF